MRGMETAGERTLHESSSLSSASAKEAMNCETDLEKDNTVTYKNDESAKSWEFGKQKSWHLRIWVQITFLPFTIYGALSKPFVLVVQFAFNWNQC